jgi:hypothetical protein
MHIFVDIYIYIYIYIYVPNRMYYICTFFTVTIFSASNYGGGGNSGAYMVFTTEPVLRNGLIPKKDSSIELPVSLIHRYIYILHITKSVY